MDSSVLTQAHPRACHVVDELVAVEAALRKIIPADLEERLLTQVPQWFLILGMFKDLEIAYTCLEDRKSLEQKYRAALTSILSLGENIWSGLQERPGLDISSIAYDRNDIQSNLRYLRAKYLQWFAQRDAKSVARTLEILEGSAHEPSAALS